MEADMAAPDQGEEQRTAVDGNGCLASDERAAVPMRAARGTAVLDPSASAFRPRSASSLGDGEVDNRLRII